MRLSQEAVRVLQSASVSLSAMVNAVYLPLPLSPDVVADMLHFSLSEGRQSFNFVFGVAVQVHAVPEPQLLPSYVNVFEAKDDLLDGLAAPGAV